MAQINLRSITFEGRHGVTSAERQGTRKFEADVFMDCDVSVAEASDKLADTYDYTVIAGIVVDIGTGEPHHLVESLARRMLDRLARTFPESRVTIELRKLAPPGCPGHPASAGVRLTSGPR